MPSSRRASVDVHRFSRLQKYVAAEGFHGGLHAHDDYDDEDWSNGDMEIASRASPQLSGSPEGSPQEGSPNDHSGGSNHAMFAAGSHSFSSTHAPVQRQASTHTRPHHNSVTSKPTGKEKERKNPAQKVRAAVSKNKVRFQEDGFDLDLTYITPRIIAMGFPSSGTEGYYRNQIDDVERFFSTRHSGNYHVYNLCSERSYDTQARFGGHHTRIPFDDHNPPVPISIIPQFIRHANTWLANSENVIAVHCKAGKGRTGVFIGCLLLAHAFEKSPHGMDSSEALKLFGRKRTKDGHGVTIPSQRRYIMYWEYLLRHNRGQLPAPRKLKLDWLKINSTVKDKGVNDIYFTITVGEKEGGRREVYTQRDCLRDFKTAFSDGKFVFEMSKLNVQVTGDVLFRVRRKNSIVSDDNLFHFWLNVDLEAERSEVYQEKGRFAIHLDKPQIDKAVKDKSHESYKRDLYVEIQFSNATTEERDLGTRSTPFSSPAVSYTRNAPPGAPSPSSSPLRAPSTSPMRKSSHNYSPLSNPSSSPTEPPSPYNLMGQSPTASPSVSPTRKHSSYKGGSSSVGPVYAAAQRHESPHHQRGSSLDLSGTKLVLPPRDASAHSSVHGVGHTSSGHGVVWVPPGHLRFSRLVFRPSRSLGGRSGLIAKMRCSEDIRFTECSELSNGSVRWGSVLEWNPLVVKGPGETVAAPDIEFSVQYTNGEVVGLATINLADMLPPLAAWGSGARSVESIGQLWKEGIPVDSTFSSPGLLHLAASYDLGRRPGAPASLQQRIHHTESDRSNDAAREGGAQRDREHDRLTPPITLSSPPTRPPSQHPKFMYYLALCSCAGAYTIVSAASVAITQRNLLFGCPSDLNLVDSPSAGSSSPLESPSERGNQEVKARLLDVVGSLRSGLTDLSRRSSQQATDDSSVSPLSQVSSSRRATLTTLPHHPHAALTSTFQCASRLSTFMLTHDAKLVRYEEKERIDLTLLDSPPVCLLCNRCCDAHMRFLSVVVV